MDGEEIQWEGSGSSVVTITDTIVGGKLGGWLDIKDEIIPEYKADMDALAGAVIWETNKVHSQGVGVEAMSSLTGTYATVNSTEELGTVDSGLTYYDSVEDGTFKVWLYDASGTLVGGGATTITIDADATSLDDLVTDVTAVDANITAALSGGKLAISASNGYTFAFSEDTSNVLAALGVNTFFTGSNANDMGMNAILDTDKGRIAAGRIDSSGGIAVGDNSNALAAAGLQYESLTIKRWTYERGIAAASSDATGTLESYLHSFLGSIGVESQSITRAREFNETIVKTLSETRDNISAVSLDEEMTNLIKYQHAYAAAAKLISAADEMLKILLETK